MFSISKPLHQMQKGIWSELCLRLQANFGILGRKTYHPLQTQLIEELNTQFRDQVQSGQSTFPLFYKHFKCLRSQEPYGSSESQASQESQEPKRPQGSQIISYIDYQRFDVCEIVAYSLVCEFKDQLLALEEKEIQREKNQPASIKKNQNSFHSVEVERRNKIYDENLNALINLFFDKLKESVESLLKSKQVKSLFPLDPYQQNVLKWQLTINIRRRCVQIMRFYEKKRDFSNKILKSYELIARKLVKYFRNQTSETDQKSEEFNNIIFPKVAQALALIEEMSPKNKTNDDNLIHHLVGDEFRALFSTNINEQLWSPYTGAQKRFQESNSSTAFKIQKDITRVIEDYSSLSFIPTSITQMIFQRIMNAPGKYHVISGFKTFGKSMNFVLFATLNNYIPLQHIVLFPTIEVTKMEVNFFEAFWHCMNKKQMEQWIDLLKQIAKPNQDYSSKIIQCFCFFENLQKKPSRKVIFDQFSTYVGKIYQKQHLNISEDENLGLKSIIKHLLLQKNQKLIFGSSVSYEIISLRKALQIDTTQQISYLEFNKFFTKQQASYIIKVWLQKVHHVNLNAKLLFIKNTSQNKQLQKSNEAQESKKVQEKNIQLLEEERLSLTQKIIDFYFSYENLKTQEKQVKYIGGSMELLKSFSENLYTSFFLSEKEVEFLKTSKYTYDQSDLAKNIIDKLKEFMIDSISKWYIKQIKHWILKENKTEINKSRRIIVSEIFLFNKFYIKRYLDILNSQQKKLPVGQKSKREQVVLPYFLIKRSDYTIYKHIKPFTQRIYNQLVNEVDLITQTTYLVDGFKTFLNFMSVKTVDITGSFIGSFLQIVFNQSMLLQQNLSQFPGFGKKYPSILKFIQTVKFSKQQQTNLRLNCPIKLFKMDSTYHLRLELDQNNLPIEGKCTRNQFVLEIQRYVYNAVQECEEKSMDLSQHPLYVYVMTAQGQPSCDGILVEVQKFQDYYSLRILMIELGVNKLAQNKVVDKLVENNFLYFHFFKEGFEKNNKKFKISSRNLAIITSSKISYEINSTDKIPAHFQQLNDKGNLSVNASPPPLLPQWHDISWDDIKLNQKESKDLYIAFKSKSKQQKEQKEQSSISNIQLKRKINTLATKITYIDVCLFDSIKEIQKVYWTYRTLSTTEKKNLLKNFHPKKQSLFEKQKNRHRKLRKL